MERKCKFDIAGYCHALACYSNQKCNARDKNGFPKYFYPHRKGEPEIVVDEDDTNYYLNV